MKPHWEFSESCNEKEMKWQRQELVWNCFRSGCSTTTSTTTHPVLCISKHHSDNCSSSGKTSFAEWLWDQILVNGDWKYFRLVGARNYYTSLSVLNFNNSLKCDISFPTNSKDKRISLPTGFSGDDSTIIKDLPDVSISKMYKSIMKKFRQGAAWEISH